MSALPSSGNILTQSKLSTYIFKQKPQHQRPNQAEFDDMTSRQKFTIAWTLIATAIATAVLSSTYITLNIRHPRDRYTVEAKIQQVSSELQFDLLGARQDGYSDEEIAIYLSKRNIAAFESQWQPIMLAVCSLYAIFILTLCAITLRNGYKSALASMDATPAEQNSMQTQPLTQLPNNSLINGREPTDLKLARTKSAVINASIIALRILRTGFLIFIAWQCVGLLALIGTSSQPFDKGKLMAWLLLKLITMLICYALTVAAKWSINRIHQKHFGKPHPAFQKRAQVL